MDSSHQSEWSYSCCLLCGAARGWTEVHGLCVVLLRQGTNRGQPSLDEPHTKRTTKQQRAVRSGGSQHATLTQSSTGENDCNDSRDPPTDVHAETRAEKKRKKRERVGRFSFWFLEGSGCQEKTRWSRVRSFCPPSSFLFSHAAWARLPAQRRLKWRRWVFSHPRRAPPPIPRHPGGLLPRPSNPLLRPVAPRVLALPRQSVLRAQTAL